MAYNYYNYYYYERQRQQAVVSKGHLQAFFHLTGAAKHLNGDFMYEGEYHKKLLLVNPREYWESIPPVYPPDAPYIPGTTLRRLPNPVTLKTTWDAVWDDKGKWAGYDPGGTRRVPREQALSVTIWDSSPINGPGWYAVEISLSDMLGQNKTPPLDTWGHLLYLNGQWDKVYWNYLVVGRTVKFY